MERNKLKINELPPPILKSKGNDLTSDDAIKEFHPRSFYCEKWHVDEPLILDNRILIPPICNVDPIDYFDKDGDFEKNEYVSGRFRGFYIYYGSKRVYALVDLDDGRKIRVGMHYLRKFGLEIYRLKDGELISLQKIDFDHKVSCTIWKVTAVPFRYFLEPATPFNGEVNTVDWVEYPKGFERGDVVEGRVVAMGYEDRLLVCAIVKLSDGMFIRVNSDMFSRNQENIWNYMTGDPIRLMKSGFMKKESRTQWLFLDTSDMK